MSLLMVLSGAELAIFTAFLIYTVLANQCVKEFDLKAFYTPAILFIGIAFLEFFFVIEPNITTADRATNIQTLFTVHFAAYIVAGLALAIFFRRFLKKIGE